MAKNLRNLGSASLVILQSLALGGCLTGSDIAAPELGTSKPSVHYGACSEAILSEAWDFNLFALGDVTQPSADTQGRVAVGGNAYFANYSIGEVLEPDADRIDLLVAGSLTFPSGAVMNGRATYGTTADVTSAASFFGGLAQAQSPIDFSAAGTYLAELSDQLGNLVPNSVADFNAFENARFETRLTGFDGVVNVFSMTADELERTHTLVISAPATSTVLINVSGNQAALHSKGVFISDVSGNRIIYNFHEATSLYIGEIEINGSILAPRADLIFPAGQVNGHLIVKSLYGQGQMNQLRFWGCLPICLDGSCEKKPPEGENCTRTIGYWKNHLAKASPFLPQDLGIIDASSTLRVDSAEIAFLILKQATYGDASNGITKLYAQLLAAKLNIAKGASNFEIAPVILLADAFLSQHSYDSWNTLSAAQQQLVLEWHEQLDLFNNGLLWPAHCE